MKERFISKNWKIQQKCPVHFRAAIVTDLRILEAIEIIEMLSKTEKYLWPRVDKSKGFQPKVVKPTDTRGGYQEGKNAIFFSLERDFLASWWSKGAITKKISEENRDLAIKSYELFHSARPMKQQKLANQGKDIVGEIK